jgi:hypothetical protein
VLEVFAEFSHPFLGEAHQALVALCGAAERPRFRLD